MKPILSLFFALVIGNACIAQASKTKSSDTAIQIVEAACGGCQFKMDGKGCNLAVRIKGKSYFVDGTSIDEHGDAHADDGFCKAVRKAEVKGSVVKNRFKLSYFKIL